jgi:hypothetical protein
MPTTFSTCTLSLRLGGSATSSPHFSPHHRTPPKDRESVHVGAAKNVVGIWATIAPLAR